MPARLQQPITGPVQVFDQEWKTRLVWSPQELEEIERFKAEIAPARQTVAAQAAPKPAAAKPPAPAKAVAERPAVEKPPAPEKPAVAAKQEAPPPKPAMKPEAPKPVAMAPKPEAPAKPAPPPPAAAKPAPAQPKPPVPSPPKPAAPPAVVAETGNEETIGIAMAPPIRLVRLKGDAGSFTLEQGTFAVGRSMAAAVRVDNRELSRNHASIVVTPTTVSVEDQGSANGTFVNDVEAKGRQPLGQGDRVAFGSVVFTVDIERKS
jgi:outer membrane biosynthesis protein TonB